MPTSRRPLAAVLACVALVAANAAPCRAINIVLDYSRDTNQFFSSGNPAGQGAAARNALQAAATFFSNILTDTFDAMQAPPNFTAASGAVVRWSWNAEFTHPATGASTPLTMAVIPADEYRIFVGARNFTGTTLGEGGPGSTAGWGRDGLGSFTSAEITQIQQITSTFEAALATRGESSGFARFGGSISFDRRASTVWHYNHTTAPAAGSNDFFSVALHEMAHALGFGASSEWSNLATGSHFSGAAAAAAYGGPPPLQSFDPDNPMPPAHWAPNTMSRILGTNTVQEAAMDPNLTQGMRKQFTTLDAGALVDIGWSIAIPSFNSADFNRDGTVNGPDLAVWRSAFRTSANASADGDGDSDGNDFLIWQRRLGQHAVAAGGFVPEPPTAALAVWAIGGRLLRRRQHA